MKNKFENIAENYEKRTSSQQVMRHSENETFNRFMVNERNYIYEHIFSNIFGNTGKLKVLEIGAGSGSNLLFFRSLGVKAENCFANDIIPARAQMLRENLPGSAVIEGNALNLDFKNYFDVVFQSTVFSSVLEDENRNKLAEKMVEMTKPGGFILWYDFMYNNPRNKDVRGVSKKEVQTLFTGTKKLFFKKVTLAPPVGRRVGKLYKLFNAFPFLRTHCIVLFQKQ